MNTAATSNQEIVDMLTRSSAAMSAANNTIQETIALETAAVEITRNAETTGTAFKTISMRLRSYNEETEEFDEELKNISGDIADLTKINGKGGISIFTDESKETYKSTYQVLKEISEIWDELNDKQHAELLEKLGGKRGGQVIAGLLTNFSAAEKAMQEMENAAGAADAEMTIIQSSISYKLNALKETWTGTLQAIIDRGDLGKAVDDLTALSEALGFIISKLGLLGTVGMAIGTWASVKNVGLLRTVTELKFATDGSVVSTQRFVTSLQARRIAENNSKIQTQQDIAALQQYELELAKCNEQQKNNIVLMSTASKEAQAYAQRIKAGTATAAGFASVASGTAQTTQSVSLLSAAFTKLGSVAKTALSSIGTGLAIGLIFTIGSKLVQQIKHQINYYKELKESVESIMTEFKDAKRQADSYKDSIEELIPTYEKLSSGVNGLGKNVSLTDEEFKEYNTTVNKIADMFPTLVQGWTDEGNAIIDLTGNVEGLRDAYKDAQKEAYNLLITGGKNGNGEDITKVYQSFFKKGIDLPGQTTAGGRITKYDAIKYLEEFANLESNDVFFYKYGSYINDYILKETGLKSNATIAEKKEAQRLAKTKAQEYRAELDKALLDTKSLANAYLYTNEDFEKLAPDVQTAISRLINGISIDEAAIKFKSKSAVGVYVREIVDSVKNNPDAQAALVQLFTLDVEKMSPEQIRQAVNEYVQMIANALGEDPIEVKVKFGFDYVDDVADKSDSLRKKALMKYNAVTESGYVLNDSLVTDYDTFIKENSVNTNDELVILGRLIDEYGTLQEAFDAYVGAVKDYGSGNRISFSEDQQKEIDDYISKTNTLHEALVKVANGTATSTELLQLKKEFGELDVTADNLETQIRDLIATMEGDFVEAIGLDVDEGDKLYNEYAKIKDEMEDLGITDTSYIFGNINTNKRKGLEWTQELVDQYREELKSLGQNPDELIGSVSTVLGAWGTYGEQSIDIAYTPMLQTEDGSLRPLSQEEIDNYLNQIVEKANGDANLILKYDREGINGVSNLVAAVGDSAEKVSQAMHYTGIDGEYAQIYNEIAQAAHDAGVSTSEWLDAHREKSELLKTIQQITIEAKRATAALNDAFSSIKSSDAAFVELGEKIKNNNVDESILSTIAGLDDELNTLVAGYYGGVVSIEQIYDKLSEVRERDFEEYKEAYVHKLKFDEDYYNKVKALKEDELKLLFEFYETDLSKCNSYEEAKFKLSKKFFIGEYSMMSSLYDIEAEQTTTLYDKMKADARDNSDANKFTDRVDTLHKAIQKLKHLGWEDLDDVTLDGFSDMNKKLSDAASSSKSEYDELFDFFERRIELLDQSIAHLDAEMQNLNSSLAKNMLLNGKITAYKNSISEYTDAMAMYQQKANEQLAKLPADLQTKIKNGAVSITQLLGENGEEINKVLTEYKNWADKIENCNTKLLELNETIRQLSLEKFNNIGTQFDNESSLIGTSLDMIQSQISLYETAGELVGEAFYQGMIDIKSNQKSVLQSKLSAQMQSLTEDLANGNIQKGTDEWVEMVTALANLETEITKCDEEIEGFENSILELNDASFERVTKRFDELSNTISDLITLMGDVEVAEENTNWTDEGLTQLGLYAQEYERNILDVQRYDKAIDELNKAYAEGKYSSTEYLDKLADLNSEQRNSAKSAEEAKKSMIEVNKARVEIIKNGIQKQIDAYKKLIDAQKEALDSEKDLHDYQRSISEKNKNIANIQKQIDALANDNSAAATAKRIKLQQSLNEAMDDLAETQYDQSVEKQKEALDQQYEDFEKIKQDEMDAWDEYLKDTEKVIQDSNEVIKKNTEAISKEIEKIAKTHGITVATEITNAWKSGEGAIAGYGEKVSEFTSDFAKQLKETEVETIGLQEKANKTAEALAQAYKAYGEGLASEFRIGIDAENEASTAAEILRQNLLEALSGGYDVSGVVGSLKAIKDAADDASQSVKDLNNQTGGNDNGNGGNDNKGGTNGNTSTNTKSSHYTNYSTEIGTPSSNEMKKVGGLIDDYISNQMTEFEKNNVDSQINAQKAKEEKTKQVRDTASLAEAKSMAKQQSIQALNNAYGTFGNLYWNPNDGYTQAFLDLDRVKDTNPSANAQYRGAKILADDEKARYTEYQEKLKAIMNQYAGYATGVHNLSKSQVAWTQELGHEAILSPTRNAILTKLNKGDTVLTKEQTDNLFKLSKLSPADILTAKLPSITPRSTSPVLTIGNILTVNGNVDDTNVKQIEAYANKAINDAFKKFSSEIIKR